MDCSGCPYPSSFKSRAGMYLRPALWICDGIEDYNVTDEDL